MELRLKNPALKRLAVAIVLVASVASLPAQTVYSDDFESAQGYSLGTLNSQNGWTASSASIVNFGFNGTQAVEIAPAFPVGVFSKNLIPGTPTGVVYYDFFAKPSADTSASSLIDTGNAKLRFLLQNGAASVQTLDGTTWTSVVPDEPLALAANSTQTAGWHRLTLREDFTASTYDLYINGQLVAYDLGFTNPAGSSLNLTVSGHAVYPTAFDYLFVAGINPLFENASNDGIDDAWKTTWGLPTATSLRGLSPRPNGIPFIQYYHLGMNPADITQGRSIAGNSPGNTNQMAFTYDASGRLTKATFGNLAAQNFAMDNASNLTASASAVQPIVAWRASYGLPADGTGNGADTAILADDGLTNLEKYAFGLDPTVAAPAGIPGGFPAVIVRQSGGSSYLAVQYVRPDPAPADLIYTVEVSADGSIWTTGSTPVSTTVSGGIATVIVQDATAATPPAYGRFIRLHVTRAPLSL